MLCGKNKISRPWRFQKNDIGHRTQITPQEISLHYCFSSMRKPFPFEDFPLLSHIPGYQLLVHSTKHECQHCPPRSASPTTRSHVKVVCCMCRQRDPFRTVHRVIDPNQSKDDLSQANEWNGNTSILSRCRDQNNKRRGADSCLSLCTRNVRTCGVEMVLMCRMSATRTSCVQL